MKVYGKGKEISTFRFEILERWIGKLGLTASVSKFSNYAFLEEGRVIGSFMSKSVYL